MDGYEVMNVIPSPMYVCFKKMQLNFDTNSSVIYIKNFKAKVYLE